MSALSGFLVSKRRLLAVITLIITVIFAALIPKVNIITDLTRFLSDSSSMKQGYDILDSEFPDLVRLSSNTIRVMFTDVPEEEKEALREKLAEIENVSSVSFTAGNIHCDKDGYSLYTLNFSHAYKSPEVKAIKRSLDNDFAGLYKMTYTVDDTNGGSLPPWIVAAALGIIIFILLLMSQSWIEPFLFLLSVGAAVGINTGLSALTEGVAATTWTMAALMQLILSIDYSVMLMSRYHLERDSHETSEETMKAAITGSFPSIASSSFTTIVGLLALLFMSIKIGADMGIVLARGVLVSMICIFTLLPAMIIALDKVITKTAKKRLHIPLGFMGKVEDKGRYFILVLFIVFFAFTAKLRGSASFAFTMTDYSPIDEIFANVNTTLVVYETADEEKAALAVEEISAMPETDRAMAWSNTMGKSFTASELKEAITEMAPDISVPGAAIDLLYAKSKASSGASLLDPNFTMTFKEMLDQVMSLKEAGLFETLESMGVSPDAFAMLDKAPAALEEYEHMLHGEKHSLIAVTTYLPAESDETFAYIDAVDEAMKKAGAGEYHLVGNSVMAWEMSKIFRHELNTVTLITALAIFVVVMVTFRSLVVPAVLVLLIQSSVFFTMILVHFQGYDIYYLALLVVQSILMGATIDYAILFTSFYREQRSSGSDRASALGTAYESSAETIFTSGLIMIIATLILGYAFDTPAIGQICLTISKGAATAVTLIVLILPGILAALDRK